MSISDEQFITQFENQTLAPCYFDHYGHLRLTWLYLNTYPLDTAIDKICYGISAYASSLGANDKFHHTLTEAIVRIVALKIENEPSLDTFLLKNDELVKDIRSIVLKHYSLELLDSDKAKKQFTEPDIKAFSDTTL